MKKRLHKRKDITEVYTRNPWLDKKVNQSAIEVYGFLVARGNQKRKNKAIKEARHQNEKITLNEHFYRYVVVSNDELKSFLTPRRGFSNVRSAKLIIQRAIKELLDAQMIVLHRKVRTAYTNHYLIEVLWDEAQGSFVASYGDLVATVFMQQTSFFVNERGNTEATKTPREATQRQHGVASLNAIQGPVEPQIDDSEGAINININLNQTLETDDQGGDVNPSLASPVATHSSDTIPSIPADEEKPKVAPPRPTALYLSDMSIDQSDIPEVFRATLPENVSVEKPAPWYSWWETEGIRQYPALHNAMRKVIERMKTKYNYDPSEILEAANYRRLVAPDLRLDWEFRFEDIPDNLHASTIMAEHTVISYIDDNFEKYGNDPRLVFICFLRRFPRGLAWEQDPGGYWAGPLLPFIMNEDGFAPHRAPWHHDYTKNQIAMSVLFRKKITSPYTGKLSFHHEFDFTRAHMMHWLCANTGLYWGALDEMIPEFWRELNSGRLGIGALFLKAVKEGRVAQQHMIKWFCDYAYQRQKNNRWIYRMRNQENQFIMKTVGIDWTEDYPLNGNTYLRKDRNGKLQEVYMAKYQFEVFDAFERKKQLQNKQIGQEGL